MRSIIGAPILPLLPQSGPVYVLVVGEAPGPRGADKSGVPFFGDAAGKHLYLALRELGAVHLPNEVDLVKWDGAALREAGYSPVARGVSLTNAWDHCPTDDGQHFRAPSREELEGPVNSARLRGEVDALTTRGLRGIVTLGKVATRTMQQLVAQYYNESIPVHALPHPSAQGLLSMAPNRGRGARMADLQTQWMSDCMAAIRAAGFDIGRVETERQVPTHILTNDHVNTLVFTSDQVHPHIAVSDVVTGVTEPKLKTKTSQHVKSTQS